MELPFDLVVLDIDGIMTDGTKEYGTDGTVLSKRYCDLDFTAIKRFQAAGIKVCFLSGDRTVNEAMAKTRKIPFFHNPPGVDKLDILPDIEREFGVARQRILYVGDDYYDIGIMKAVGTSFCPDKSPASVRRAATYSLGTEPGHGFVATVYDEFGRAIPECYPKDSPDVNPQAQV